MMSETITILSMDPGTKNFAASILKAKRKGDRLLLKVIGTKMIGDTIQDIGNPQEDSEAFRAEVSRLVETHGVTHITAERFQTRGIKGKTIESICMMLGIIVNEFSHLDIRYFTASTWKNQYNRSLDLKELYVDLKDQKSNVEVHELDCTLMGIYRLCQLFDLPYFCNVDTYKKEKAFLGRLVEAPKL